MKQKEEYLRQLIAKKLDNKEIRTANILTARHFREVNPNRECPLCDDGSKHTADKCPAIQNGIIGDKPKRTIECQHCQQTNKLVLFNCKCNLTAFKHFEEQNKAKQEKVQLSHSRELIQQRNTMQLVPVNQQITQPQYQLPPMSPIYNFGQIYGYTPTSHCWPQTLAMPVNVHQRKDNWLPNTWPPNRTTKEYDAGSPNTTTKF